MRKSGIIIGLLIFSIFQGIGITRTQGLTEVIYEGDWVVDTDTTISETDLNITVKNNLIITNDAVLKSYSRINVLGNVVVGDSTYGEWLIHYSSLYVYGDLNIYQEMVSSGDLYVGNTINVVKGGDLDVNDANLTAKNIILTSSGRIMIEGSEVKITENLNLEDTSSVRIRNNSHLNVDGDVKVHSLAYLYLNEATAWIGGIVNTSSIVSLTDSDINVQDTIYTYKGHINSKLSLSNSVLKVENSLQLKGYALISDSEIIQTNEGYQGYFINTLSLGYFESTHIVSHSEPIYNYDSFIFTNSSIDYDGTGYHITSKSNQFAANFYNNTFPNPIRIKNVGVTIFNNNINSGTELVTSEFGIHVNNNTGPLDISVENISSIDTNEIYNNSISNLSMSNVNNFLLTNNSIGEASFRDITNVEIYNNTFAGQASFDGKLDSVKIKDNKMTDVVSSTLDMINSIVTNNTFTGPVSGISLLPFPEAIYPGIILDLTGLGIQLSYSFDGAEKISGATEIVFPDTIGTHEIWLDVSSSSNIFVGSFMIEIVEEPVVIEPTTPTGTRTNEIETTPKTDEAPASQYSPLWFLLPMVYLVILRKRK